MDMLCTPKYLPRDEQHAAAATAVNENPVNAPRLQVALPPQHIAMLTSRYWGPTTRTLGVSFLEYTGHGLREQIIGYMNKWHAGGAGIDFVYSRRDGDVRITRMADGYWSYLGTDIRSIPQGEPTMCLQAFTLRTPLSEYDRVVTHETGHTLGFEHEHMRRDLVALLDPERTYAYFWETQRWDRETVDQQVLTSLDERSLMGTPPDVDSVMCYQLPGVITKTGQPIRGGVRIDVTDQAFANKVYPRPVTVGDGASC